MAETEEIEMMSPVTPSLQKDAPHSISIAALRVRKFPASEIILDEKLPDGDRHERLLVHYTSDGLKINALLTIPSGESPKGGWPAIIFNHGYIPPHQYKTTERYVAYVAGFARNGYIVLRPDFRGHGDSEGVATGGYGSNDYTIDVLNALSALKIHPKVNPEKIGMWGHSMGGHITLRSMVVDKSIKAGVIWGGVVGSYAEMLYNWRSRVGFTPPPITGFNRRWRVELVEKYGTPEVNPDFWNSLSSTSFLKDISGPVQLHHGEKDESVPVEFSRSLDTRLREASKTVETFVYKGDDHDITANFGVAMRRSVEFFDRYLKTQ